MRDDASIYRAISDQGLGEGPGIQYLDSGSPLEQDADFLDAAQIWMTIHGEEWPLVGDDFEAWSIAPIGPYLLVVRLERFGVYGTEHRPNFFAHGRAVDRERIGGAFDPGAWMSDVQAFDVPWLGRRRKTPAPTPTPRPPSVAPVVADPALAETLVAHLYEASLQKRPLIWKLPLQEFRKTGRAATLASLARAALPLALRRDCFVRVFATGANGFIQAGANFLVVPDGNPLTMQLAQAARADAFVLGPSGNRIEGDRPRDTLQAYSKIVVRRFLDRPDGLLHFGARCEVVLGGKEPSASPRAYAVLYNVSEYSRQNALDEALAHVVKQLEARPIGTPPASPAKLFLDEEWGRFSLNALANVLLSEVGTSAELQALQDACRRQIVEGRRTTLDSELAWWAASFSKEHLPQLASFLRDPPLVPTRLAQTLLQRVGVGALPDLTPVQLGQLRRAIDWPACVELDDASAHTLATKGFAADLLSAMRDYATPAPWLLSFIANEPVAALQPPADVLVRKAAVSSSWHAPLLSLANRVLAEPLSAMWATTLAGLDSSPFRSNLELIMALEELKSRARSGKKEPSPILKRLATRPGFYEGLTSDQRREWVRRALDPEWCSLDKALLMEDGACLVPRDAAYDAAIWSHLCSMLNPRALKEVFEVLPDQAERSAEFIEEIDRRLEIRPADANEWFGPLHARSDDDADESVVDYSEWRARSRLQSAVSIAKEWFLGSQWKDSRRWAPFADWQFVMHDLARSLDAKATSDLIRKTPAVLGFPRVPGLERQQVPGLCEAVVGLPAFVELAQALEHRVRNWPPDLPDCPFLEELQDDVIGSLLKCAQALSPSRFANISADAVRWVARLEFCKNTGVKPLVLGLEEARALWEELGNSHKDAALGFANSVLRTLPSNPERAVALAAKFRLFTDVTRVSDAFIVALREQLTSNYVEPYIALAAPALDPLLTVDVRRRASATNTRSKKDRERAAKYLRDYPNIAKFINPEFVAFTSPGRRAPLTQDLLNGTARAWNDLAEDYRRFVNKIDASNPFIPVYREMQSLEALHGQLAVDARRELQANLCRHPVFFQPAPDPEQHGIPAVKLILLVDGRSALQCLRWLIQNATTPTAIQWLKVPAWWEILNADVRRVRAVECDWDDRDDEHDLPLSAQLADLAVEVTGRDEVGDAAWSIVNGVRSALSPTAVQNLRTLRGRWR